MAGRAGAPAQGPFAHPACRQRPSRTRGSPRRARRVDDEQPTGVHLDPPATTSTTTTGTEHITAFPARSEPDSSTSAPGPPAQVLHNEVGRSRRGRQRGRQRRWSRCVDPEAPWGVLVLSGSKLSSTSSLWVPETS